jgi:hypothetical protein
VRPPPRTSSKLLALAGVAALGAAGCATAPPKMSFGDAGFHVAPASPEPDLTEEPEGPVEPPAAVPAPESFATELPAGPPIDALLMRFTVDARARRARHPAHAGFPDEAAEAWRDLAGELDHYLARPLPQTPLMELVRARVTVEAEWDYDERRFGPAPAALAAELRARAARLGRRVEAGRALGFSLFARPAPAKLRWPVEQAGLSSLFGMRVHPVEGRRRMHRGVDLAASTGRVVSAAAAGWVVRAGWTGGYGLMVEVRHPGDLTTRYSHLSAILCSPGDALDPGQPLGLVGRTGLATGPHLHFEVWRAGEPKDPLPWLGLARTAGSAGN